MFRLLGFLIGSVAAMTIILLVLGVPEFHLTDPAIDQQRFDAAVEKLKKKQQEVASIAENMTEDIVDEVAESIGNVQDRVDTVAKRGSPKTVARVAEGSPLSREAVDGSPAPDLADVNPAIQDESLWYSFWNPFRSEIAARGFVTQLEKVTGLDYRVVKVKTGVYEVAFAYGDDVERRTKLSQISAATGLDLPDS